MHKKNCACDSCWEMLDILPTWEDYDSQYDE